MPGKIARNTPAARSRKITYGCQLPELHTTNLPGKLFVVEGADGSGRSTHIRLLSEWLESNGHAVEHMGLRRSPLLANDIEQAKQSNILTHTTMSLFYATDFFDQLVHEIIPALRAGYVVLADRYIYTLMARDIVRGSSPEWTQNLYSPALIPDAVCYLSVEPKQLVLRNFEKSASLDYWESGMDLGLSRDMFDSFLQFQQLLQAEFARMQKRYGFEIINANRNVATVQKALRTHLGRILGISV
jgi:dTMP kinase